MPAADRMFFLRSSCLFAVCTGFSDTAEPATITEQTMHSRNATSRVLAGGFLLSR
jgi:hypothetical protein